MVSVPSANGHGESCPCKESPGLSKWSRLQKETPWIYSAPRRYEDEMGQKSPHATEWGKDFPSVNSKLKLTITKLWVTGTNCKLTLGSGFRQIVNLRTCSSKIPDCSAHMDYTWIRGSHVLNLTENHCGHLPEGCKTDLLTFWITASQRFDSHCRTCRILCAGN